jgi:hypothetical protein
MPFDGDLSLFHDVVGAPAAITRRSAAPFTFVDGRVGQALAVPAGAFLCVGSTAITDAGNEEMSVSFWYRNRVPGNTRGVIVASADSVPAGGAGGFAITGGAAAAELGLTARGSDAAFDLPAAYTTAGVSAWRHVYLAKDKDKPINLYVDGVLRMSDVDVGRMPSTNGICIGNTAVNDQANVEFSSFEIDDFYISSKFQDSAASIAANTGIGTYLPDEQLRLKRAEIISQSSSLGGAANVIQFKLEAWRFKIPVGTTITISGITGSSTESGTLPITGDFGTTALMGPNHRDTHCHQFT